MKNPSETASILVPVDFSEITASAIEHAALMSRLFEKQITLLHVVAKSLFESDHQTQLHEEEAQSKLENLADDLFSIHGIEAAYIVRTGAAYQTISEIAAELNATLVVMGTHGVKGIQHIFGSHVIKTIGKTEEIPYLIVQDVPSPGKTYSKVVLPLSFTVESRQKLTWAVYLSNVFNCSFEVFVESETDEFLKNKLESNLVFAKKYLAKNNCAYTLNFATGSTTFHNEIVEFAGEIKADLILLMTEEEADWTEFFVGPHEQNIIANKFKIPVFCMKPIDNMQIERSAMFQ